MKVNDSMIRAAVLLAVTMPVPAMAYVGPGAGLGAVGTVIALLGAIVLGIVGFVWYPIKRFLNRNKSKQLETTDGDAREQNEESLEVESAPQE